MRTIGAALLATWVFGVSAVPGQGPRGRNGGPPPVQVGSELADVTAFDERGEAFPLREKLAGRHAVIVFGCLT